MEEKKSQTKQNKIEELVDKKILEAKLIITEKRLSFVLFLMAGIVAVFGIFLPMYQSNLLENKTEKAISQMQKEFDQIVGKQLREPELKCFLNGRDLTNQTIEFVSSYVKKGTIERSIVIKNIGEKMVPNFEVYLYYKSNNGNTKISYSNHPNFYMYNQANLDGYDICYKMWDESFKIHPTDSFSLVIYNPIHRKGKDDVDIIELSCLMKVYYDQLEPLEVPFKIIVKNEK